MKQLGGTREDLPHGAILPADLAGIVGGERAEPMAGGGGRGSVKGVG